MCYRIISNLNTGIIFFRLITYGHGLNTQIIMLGLIILMQNTYLYSSTKDLVRFFRKIDLILIKINIIIYQTIKKSNKKNNHNISN